MHETLDGCIIRKLERLKGRSFILGCSKKGLFGLKITAERLAQAKLKEPGRRLTGWQLDSLALLFFVLMAVAMTWPVTPNLGRSLEQWGDALLQTWTLDWDAHAFVSNPLHFADANSFYPYANTLAFSETLVGQAILVAPVIWLTNNPVLAYNLLLLGSFVLCGWGMYLLGKDLTGSRVAGLIAGMIFGFFPHRFGQLSHLHLLTAQWMPFCLLFLRRFVSTGREAKTQPTKPPTKKKRVTITWWAIKTHQEEPPESTFSEVPIASIEAKTEPESNSLSPVIASTEPSLSPPGAKAYGGFRWRDGLLFGLFLTLELLSSTYLGLFLVVAVGLYLIFHATRALWPTRKFIPQSSILNPSRAEARSYNSVLSPQSFLSSFNKLARLCIILVVAGLVIVPLYWPYLSVQQDLGFERSVAEVQSFSAQPFYYLDVPKENRLNQLFYRPVFKQGWWQGSAGGERGLYLGLTALVLGAIGLGLALRKKTRRDPDALFYAVLGLLAFSFTFGPYWQSGRFGAIPLPYALLYNYVPGFAAIRVPVRFIYVVALALAALAAFGVAWIQRRWRLEQGWKGAMLACGLLALLSGEYWSEVTLQESDVLRREAPAVERWLNEHPAPTLRVPLSGSDNSNLFIQYWTRDTWRPVMNGFSGFMPPAYDALKLTVAREGFSPRVVELLQGLEVRYVVIETEDDATRAQWPKLKAGLEQAQAKVTAQFGSTQVYELKDDPWLTRLKEVGVGPDSAVYFVEYGRNQGQLLELTASYLQRRGVVKRENLYGSISVGFRPLPPLPEGKPADFLALASGEDPTLYGFRPVDKAFGNQLVTFYKKSADLLARYDFSRQDTIGALNRESMLIAPRNPGLVFDKPGSDTNSEETYLSLGLAVLSPQKLTITPRINPNEPDQKSAQTLELKPGLSVYRVKRGQGIDISGGPFSLVWAEVWRGSPPTDKTGPELRSDVVLLSSGAEFDEKNATGVAKVQVVVPGQAVGYSATLDIYNSPWGSHPNGHYGYWTLPLDTGNKNDLEWRLNLTRKQMTTFVNGREVPNFPPDPKDLDLAKYGNYGDFRANLNLFAGAKLVGSARLFDFTTWAQGDKNRLDNRRAGGFKGYSTRLAFLVLPK